MKNNSFFDRLWFERLCGVEAIAVAVLLVSGQSVTAHPALETKASGLRTFYADDRAGNNQVTVFSESTLEDFTGVCNRVSGQCEIDPKKIPSLKGKFSIRAADLQTGIDLRDRHMIGPDWLDAAQYPEVSIQIDTAEEIVKTSANSAKLMLVGTCKLRGTTKNVRIPATLTYLDESPETMRRVKGDLLRIRSEFDLRLADYGISGPAGSDFIGLKVSETVKIRVTVFGSTERPADPLKVDRPEGTAKRNPAPPAERPAPPPSSTP